jgi:hypothetical protein
MKQQNYRILDKLIKLFNQMIKTGEMNFSSLQWAVRDFRSRGGEQSLV